VPVPASTEVESSPPQTSTTSKLIKSMKPADPSEPSSPVEGEEKTVKELLEASRLKNQLEMKA